MAETDWQFSLASVQEAINARTDGKRFHYPLHHGTMRVGLYAPRVDDPQLPHTQDEIYIVLSGSGEFVKGGERRAFHPHDILFVEAGAVHRFENFTDDFSTWVVFWGPQGGEGGA
jgi:mannose-6-phosphate isomerase-like protein (cupin superfamily)